MKEPDKIKLQICNVCAVVSLRCHLNLTKIAQNSMDTYYNSYENLLRTELRNPKITRAQIWSSGKMTILGGTSIESAKKGAKIIAARLKKIEPCVKFCNFKIVNILTSFKLNYEINLQEIYNSDRIKFVYEPELDQFLYYYPNPTAKGLKYNVYRTMAKCTKSGKVVVHSLTIPEAEEVAAKISNIVKNFKIKKYVSSKPKKVLIKTFCSETNDTKPCLPTLPPVDLNNNSTPYQNITQLTTEETNSILDTLLDDFI